MDFLETAELKSDVDTVIVVTIKDLMIYSLSQTGRPLSTGILSASHQLSHRYLSYLTVLVTSNYYLTILVTSKIVKLMEIVTISGMEIWQILGKNATKVRIFPLPLYLGGK